MALPEFIFSPRGAGGLPTYEALEQRRRIAAAIMARNSAYPTTIGQGLASLGRDIGDRRILDKAEEAEAALSRYSAGKVPTLSAPEYAPYDPAGGSTPAAPVSSGGQPRSVGAQTSSIAPGMITEGDNAPSPLDPPSGAERDAVIRTTLAEAGNQGPTGMNAVASVIRNRSLNAPNTSPTAVVTAPNQFEPWNTAAGRSKMAAINPSSPAYQAAGRSLDAAYAGNDPTSGATHFYAPKAQAALGRAPPRWDDGTGQDIGAHRFFGGRDGIAATLAAQQQPPVQVASLDPQAGTGSPPPPATAAEPPVQVAQAGPVTGIQKAPQGPAPANYLPSMTPDMQRLLQAANDPHLSPAQRHQAAEAFKFQQDRIKEINTRLQQERAPYVKQSLEEQAAIAKEARESAAKANDPKARLELDKARDEAAQRQLYGNMPPAEIHKTVTESHGMARAAVAGLEASQNARAAVKGAIMGFGANQRLDIARALHGMGLVDKGNEIANSETFVGAMQPIIASILRTTSGTSGLSQGELAFAQNAAAGRLTLDPTSVTRLLDIIDRQGKKVAIDHHRKVETIFGENPKAKALYGVDLPTLHYNSEAEAEADKLPKGTRVNINGKIGKVQ